MREACLFETISELCLFVFISLTIMKSCFHLVSSFPRKMDMIRNVKCALLNDAKLHWIRVSMAMSIVTIYKWASIASFTHFDVSYFPVNSFHSIQDEHVISQRNANSLAFNISFATGYIKSIQSNINLVNQIVTLQPNWLDWQKI